MVVGGGKQFNFQCRTWQFSLCRDKKAISRDGLLIQAAFAFPGSLLTLLCVCLWKSSLL